MHITHGRKVSRCCPNSKEGYCITYSITIGSTEYKEGVTICVRVKDTITDRTHGSCNTFNEDVDEVCEANNDIEEITE